MSSRWSVDVLRVVLDQRVRRLPARRHGHRIDLEDDPLVEAGGGVVSGALGGPVETLDRLLRLADTPGAGRMAERMPPPGNPTINVKIIRMVTLFRFMRVSPVFLSLILLFSFHRF